MYFGIGGNQTRLLQVNNFLIIKSRPSNAERNIINIDVNTEICLNLQTHKKEELINEQKSQKRRIKKSLRQQKHPVP